MKVLLIDDEIKVCNLMMNLVNWEALGLKVVGVVNDGKSAYQKIQELSPDIVITDIRMPGYTGIELIQKVRETNKDVHFIIVSGYRQFEYASQAIKFGVEDYLLKPLKQVELERILHKIVQQHEAKIDRNRQQESMARQMHQSMEQLREHFLQLLMDPQKYEASRRTLAQVNETYHCHLMEGAYQLLLVQAAIDQGQPDFKADMLLDKKVKDILESQLAPALHEMVVGVADGYVACVMNGSDEQFDDLKKQLKRIVGMMLPLKDLFEAVDLSVAVSEVVRSFDDLPQCVHQARVAMMQRILLPAGALLEYPPPDALYLDAAAVADAAFRAEFKKRVTLLDAQGVRDAIAGIHDRLKRMDKLTGWSVVQICQEILILFEVNMRENGVPTPENLLADTRRRLLGAHSLSEAFTALKNACVTTMEEWRQTKEAEDTKPIRKAKQYIHDHYAEPLTLPCVAFEVGLNPSYLSTLFKKETGKNFLDYLMETRIDVAKELLVETDMSISEVAEKVGYNDMKYFYKRFRQQTGVSLKEYRKLYN